MPDLGNTSVFSQTDASNGSGTQPSWLGSAAPSTLDDAGRALQGAVTREWNWRSYTLTAGGTADAKTLTYSVAPAAYYNGQRFAFIANTTNTTSATLNVNGLGAKTIKSMATGTLANLSASNMVAGEYVEVAYNLANDCFVWVNQSDILPQALGTGDSPQFAGVNIGNASDTTITRSAAGVIAVEGGVVPKENRNNTFSVDQYFSGNVGIGTTSMSKKFVVSNGGAAGLEIDPFGRSGETATSLLSYNRSGAAFIPAHYDASQHIIYTSTTERMRIDASGNVGIGTSSPSSYGKLAVSEGNITAVKSTGITSIAAVSSTIATTLEANSGGVGTVGTQSNHPFWLMTNNSVKAVIGTDGSFVLTSSGGLGYGTGSGGTVTQITSKATGVTINKTNGQIITHNASLGAASEVSFTVTNSTVAATDNIILTKVSGGTATRYQLYVGAVAAGSFVVSIRNVDSTAQSDVITFNFAVIKSVTS